MPACTSRLPLLLKPIAMSVVALPVLR